MLKRYFFSFILLSTSLFSLEGQENLAFYCDVMNNAYEANHRIYASEQFEKVFLNELAKENSFQNDFSELKWVSIKKPSDQSFRIITWQIKEDNNHMYKGVIQMSDGTIFTLDDQSSQMPDAEHEQHDPSYWYGALYYNMIERKVGNTTSYFLFGFNGVNDDIQIKVIDELHFEDEQPVFGNESFKIVDDEDREEFKHRIVIDYSDKANVNSNFNEGMGMIVHDFVTPRLGISNTGRPVKIPDGTYVGFKWEKDHWVKINKIEHQISTPESIYYQPKAKDDKDLFGKPTKKN